MGKYSSMLSRVRNLTSAKRQKRKRSAAYSRRRLRHSYEGVTVGFITRAGRLLIKRFKSRQSASRAVRGWRAKGGRIHAIH